MAKQIGPSLFDVIDTEVAKEQVAAGKPCTHPVMKPTDTLWPNDTTVRWTMTCDACGYVRGRYPKEPRE